MSVVHEQVPIRQNTSRLLWLWIAIIAILAWIASYFLRCDQILFGENVLLALVFLVALIVTQVRRKRARALTGNVDINLTITYKEIIAFAFLCAVLYAIYYGFDPGKLLDITKPRLC